jgi:hypothetical protein
MDESIESSDLSPQSRKKREYVADGHKKPIKATSRQKQQHGVQRNQKVTELKENVEVEGYSAMALPSENLAEQDAAEEQLTPFSSLLHNIIRRDRAEVARIAHKLDVAENTIYRWMNGVSEPRPAHLRRLIEAFPSYHESFIYAIRQTFGSAKGDLSIYT